MAEENKAAEVEQKAEASFGEGFGAAPVVESTKGAEETKTEPVAEPAVVPSADAPSPVPEKPRYAKILQTELDTIRNAAGKVPGLQSEVARLANAIGNTAQLEQRIVEKVKALTPAGLTVDLSDEDFADLAAEFPELAKHTRSTLERVFKKAGVRGTGEQAPAQDVEKVVESVLTKREQQQETDRFLKAYPEWEKIVNRVDVSKGEKPDEANEFRRWVAQQSAERQKQINGTNSYAELHAVLDEYTASKTAPPPAARPDRGAARRAIMEDAVTPRTDGSPPTMSPPPSVDEAFASGFKQARGRAHA